MTGNWATPRHRIRYSKAFTIVELLIVIVVIAILAAITIVAYNGISQKAKQSAAASAAESAAKKVLTYAGTNSDLLPPDLATAEITNDANTVFEYSYDNTAKSYCITATFRGVSYYISSTAPNPVAGLCPGHTGGLPAWTQISGGYNGTCGVYGGKAYCWGDDSYGQVGNNTTTANIMVPTAVTATGVLSGLTINEAMYGRGPGGDTTSCASATNGNLYCWGVGTNGELGNGGSANSLVPVAVTMTGALNGTTLTSLSVGQDHSCVLSSGNVYCWGRNQNGLGSLGNGSAASSNVPSAVTTSGVLSGKTVTKLAKSKGLHNCVIASDSKAYCWGYNYSGYLGNNSTTTSLVPVAVYTAGVLSGKTVTDIAAGGDMSCAIASGAPYCWGYGAYGNLGNGSSTDSSIPVAVTTSGVLSGKTITAIAAGDDHACVLADGAPYCWGNNNFGQLGNNTTTNSNVPVATNVSGVLAGKTITSIALGTRHTCVIASGSAYCWGYNGNGQLGNNSLTASSVPVQVTNP